eukprot:364750-Chlamydomonas_euryale.AAC.8
MRMQGVGLGHCSRRRNNPPERRPDARRSSSREEEGVSAGGMGGRGNAEGGRRELVQQAGASWCSRQARLTEAWDVAVVVAAGL